jgi:hypothetical protein
MFRSKTMAHRTLGTRAVIAGLCASVLAGGCAATVPSLYTGTGSLAVSGSPNQPVLASHSVFFGECPSERQPANNREVEPFSIVVVGDACVMGGTGGPSAFHPDPGTVCTLRFLDGVQRVRVTDFAARLSLKPWGNAGDVQVEIGGDDPTTAQHVLYRFAGNAADAIQPRVSCDEERAKHVAQAPGAVRFVVDGFVGPGSREPVRV